MTIKCFVCNPYMQNTYVVSTGKQCVIIDAGMYTPDEQQAVAEYIRQQQLQVEAILITHSHPDHICGLPWLEQTYPNAHTRAYNTFTRTSEEPEPVLHYAGLDIRCLFTPGHKDDCVCYYLPEQGVLFSGDTLFRESVGRTDMPGGDYRTLIESLNELMRLPDDTTVYAGHSEPTTIEHEKRFNPFI